MTINLQEERNAVNAALKKADELNIIGAIGVPGSNVENDHAVAQTGADLFIKKLWKKYPKGYF